jgi:hypothetical protein
LLALPLFNKCQNTFPTEFQDRNSNNFQTRLSGDVILDGSEEEIASTVKKQYSLLKSLTDNPGQEKIIAYKNSSGKPLFLKISVVKEKAASYHHVRLQKENGEAAHLLWGMDGIYPSIKFTDDDGETLRINRTELEFPLKSLDGPISTPVDWLILGIKILAAALLIWIGASILKYVLAAIAFIAFNAMAIGAVVIGLSVLIPLIKWLIEKTGWSLSSILAFFERTVEEILLTLLDIKTSE